MISVLGYSKERRYQCIHQATHRRRDSLMGDLITRARFTYVLFGLSSQSRTHTLFDHTSKQRVGVFLIRLRIAHALPGRAQGQNAHMFAEQLAGRCTCSGLAGAEEGGRGAVETNCAGHLAERCKTQSTTPSCSNCVKSASKE